MPTSVQEPQQAPILRVATLADLPVLRKFELALIAAERPFNSSIQSEAQTDLSYYNLPDLIQSVDAKLVVVELSQRIIATGFIQISRSLSHLAHDQHGYLGFMYVDKAHRGAGINGLVMEHLLSWGKRQGVKDFYLDAYAENDPAIRAYQKLGFVPSKLSLKLNI